MTTLTPIGDDHLPRLAYEALPSPLQARLSARVERLGYLGEFFAVAAHHPDALQGFVDFTEALVASLSPRWLNVIALTIATEAGNEYERNQHEQRCLVLGIDREWVWAAEHGQPDDSGPLDADELLLRQLARASYLHDAVTARDSTRQLLDRCGPQLTVTCLLTIGRYVAHSAVATAVGFRPPVSSIFEDGR